MITLRITEALHNQLSDVAAGPMETGAVLLAHLVGADSARPALIGRELIEVPDAAYEVRTDQSLQISSDGYVHALKRARDIGAVAIWVHSHPGELAIPRPSRHDAVVNQQLEELFGDRTESGFYAYLVVSHLRGQLAFTGAATGTVSAPIARIAAVGDLWRFMHSFDSAEKDTDPLFDRHIRAFGGGIQKAISELTVAVVGAGGTGSAVAEQLVRLGVRDITLIDPDHLSLSNTTRVYGSTPRDVGRPKVETLGEHLGRIADGVQVHTLHGSILEEAVFRELLTMDIVFGCTDDDAGRLRLSRLPYYYLIPVIDCGVQIPSDTSGQIVGIYGRVTTMYPGTACLVCRDRVDLARADAEMRAEADQERLAREAYAPSLVGVEASVVAFTSMVGATVVSEFIERLVGHGERPSPTELVLYIHDRQVRGNSSAPRPRHYCDGDNRFFSPDTERLVGMNWDR